MGFSEKVVVITGASAGIGAAIAVKFAEQRANVVLVARNQKNLKEVAEKCQEYGCTPFIIVADVSKDADTKKVIQNTIAKYGRIDILVNNAGIIADAAIYEENAMQVYDRIMTTNLRAAVYLTNLAAPHLIETRGNIINISSIAAVDTVNSGNFAYCTSKAGMDHFTRSVALDLGPKGVRVNTVNPGPVHTGIIDYRGPSRDEIWKQWEPNTALGRVSAPEEIGDLVLFLASDKAKSITGSSYLTDNGVLLKRNIKLSAD
ncbi:3-oxoacyl-[acyl-carrier-protein] reductase FabG-like [Anticarsia gemmatalis]|uniref:3-oxoacyl-[acyl-carrier-protein] reductase FabG-like n=1 Tax=Anticarsia gemmatalis TaxID=129554 RepID=UPI003F75E58B